MNPLAGLFAATRLALRQFLNGPRKWILLLLGAVFPGLLALYVFVIEHGPIHPFLQSFDWFYLSAILLLICLLGATSGFSADAEDGTIIYLFTRPTPRWQIVLGKWLGTVPPLMLLCILPVLIAWPIALRQDHVAEVAAAPPPAISDVKPASTEGMPPGSNPSQRPSPQPRRPAAHLPATGNDLALVLFGTALAVLEFGTVFYALGVIVSRPYVVGLCYAFIVELIMGIIPFKLWVIAKFLRGALFRIPTPVPRFWESDLEKLPSVLVCVIGLVAVPVLSLAAAAFIAGRKSYLTKGE